MTRSRKWPKYSSTAGFTYRMTPSWSSTIRRSCSSPSRRTYHSSRAWNARSARRRTIWLTTVSATARTLATSSSVHGGRAGEVTSPSTPRSSPSTRSEVRSLRPTGVPRERRRRALAPWRRLAGRSVLVEVDVDMGDPLEPRRHRRERYFADRPRQGSAHPATRRAGAAHPHRGRSCRSTPRRRRAARRGRADVPRGDRRTRRDARSARSERTLRRTRRAPAGGRARGSNRLVVVMSRPTIVCTRRARPQAGRRAAAPRASMSTSSPVVACRNHSSPVHAPRLAQRGDDLPSISGRSSGGSTAREVSCFGGHVDGHADGAPQRLVRVQPGPARFRHVHQRVGAVHQRLQPRPLALRGSPQRQVATHVQPVRVEAALVERPG